MAPLQNFLYDNFWRFDFGIGGLTPIITYILYRTGVINRLVWRLFWVGFALGLCFEIPLSVTNAFSQTMPFAYFARPLPAHFSVLIVSHSFWDAGILLLGVLLVWLLSREKYFDAFNWRELLTLIVWGQVTELAVELTSTFNHAWVYIPYWWNPSLFKFKGFDLCLLLQLIWLAAPVVFYLIALRMKSSYRWR